MNEIKSSRKVSVSIIRVQKNCQEAGFRKIVIPNFMKIHPAEADFFPCGWTDGRTGRHT